MVAKTLLSVKRMMLATTLCGLSSLSQAGWDFWPFKTSETSTVSSSRDWNDLSETEQRALLKRYQELKELPEGDGAALQQRMEWFTQLTEQEQQKMRETWQKMSTQERKDLRKRMQKAPPDQRALIRAEYIRKYDKP